jgi:hypothetical protein
MRNATKFTALLNAVLVLTSTGSGQTVSPHATSAPSPQPQETISAPQQPSTSDGNETPHTAPVFWITSVEVMRSAHAPQLDVVRVRGLVSTEGWESAELVPITKGVPADGILELAFIAEAPADSTAPTSYPEIEAVFTIEPGHPFKGVRVHGAANRVVLQTFPGYAETSAPPRDCVSCAGKYFVRKGEAVPANRKPDSIVREEDLPRKLRVIRESDGIGSLDSDPNRMTLLLDEKGEITTAMWD